MRRIVNHPPRRLVLEAFQGRRLRLLATVVITGIAGGLVGAAYVGLLHLVQRGLWPTHWGDWPHAAILVAVGIAVAVLTKALGSPGDVELLVDNIHVLGGAEDYRSLRPLIPISLLCVGSGGGLGPEAPLVQTTGTVGSWLGTRWRLERADLRIVTITGMAAGFTVLFGAPLGSAVFALEILHRRGLEYYEALLPAVIGSLSGYAVYVVTTGLGLDAVWHFPDPGAIHAVDLAWAVGCGVVGALVAAIFTGGSVVLRKLFRKLPVAVRPVLGGVALAALAFLTPYALTFGEAQISDLSTTTKLLTGGLLLAFVGKLAGTSVTLSSGWRGGFIIPLFFMGLCLGQAAFNILPGTNEWVLVTCLMAACNVGVTKTPIGTTLVVTEMANQRLLPTILIAAVVSLVLTSGVGLIDSQRRRDGAFGESEPHTAAHLDGDDLANAHPTPVRR